MNKKVIIVVVIVVAIVLGIIVTCSLINNSSNNDSNNIESNLSNQVIEENDVTTNTTTETSKTLVLYFSATGNTEEIAKYIQEVTEGDICEIVPKEEYTSDDLNYSNDDCRANIEQNDESARPEIANEINVEDYDVIYLGYPIWWNDVPKIMLTLLDSYDLSGKTVIPFCTSGGSSISQSVNTLKSYNGSINWIEGKRFSSASSKSDVETWISELNLK